MIIDQVLTYF